MLNGRQNLIVKLLKIEIPPTRSVVVASSMDLFFFFLVNLVKNGNYYILFNQVLDRCCGEAKVFCQRKCLSVVLQIRWLSLVRCASLISRKTKSLKLRRRQQPSIITAALFLSNTLNWR